MDYRSLHMKTVADLRRIAKEEKIKVPAGTNKAVLVEMIVEKLKEMRINIRAIPFDQSNTEGVCLITGKKATLDVIYARSY